MAANLSPSELTKPGREWRIDKFLDMYKNGEFFTTTSGKKIKLLYDKKIADNIKRKMNLNTLEFIVVEGMPGKKVKLKDLAKTKEFGGQADTKKSTTHIEEKEISSIRDQLNEIRKETKQSTVPIKIGTKIYEVYDIEKTQGTPKSDFHFLDINGKPIVWMSHKDGNKASDFQQWGGISKTVPTVHSHKETKTFIEQVEKTFPKGFPSKTNIIKEINDDILKAKAVYGDDYSRGSRKYGEDNVTLLLQGPVKLKKVGNYYTVVANHVHKNGEKMKGDYEPIFDGMYRSGRGQPVPNARLGIWPKYIERRPNTIKLPTKK